MKESAEIVNATIETKIKRTRNRPDLANFGQEYVKPGDNSRYLREARVSMNLPPIDISDPQQVANRINEYFDYCEKNDKKPQMVGMGNWLGVDRSTVIAWQRGEYRSGTHMQIIQRAICVLNELWVDYMQNGKINPASGIFLGKNMFGYKDVVDLVHTPNAGMVQAADPDEMAKKYANQLPPAEDE